MKALLTGITGQMGSYLAELLLARGFEVHGIVRRSSTFHSQRIDHILDRVTLHYGDLTDFVSLLSVIGEVRPDRIYNLAAMSHVKVSYEMPLFTADVTGIGLVRVLDAVRKIDPAIRVLQVSSSEMFGKVLETPQTENTPLNPRSPYGCAKAFAHHMAKAYREAYGMNIRRAICFNYDSPRRGETFLTRKVAIGAAKIKYGLEKKLILGNLDAKRDFGYAPDYAEALYCIMEHETADDFLAATGETHSIQEFVSEAFSVAGLYWRNHVISDEKYFRPAEVDALQGDAGKIKKVLGWEPRVRFKDLARIMVEHEMKKYAGKA